MASRDEVRALLQELGPSTEDIAAIVQVDEAEWAVAYDEETIVSVDVDEDGTVLLQIEIGQPSEDRRLEVYAGLLSYNMLLRETGGVTMALAGEDGPLVQLLTLPLAGLSVADLRTVLANFADKARVWTTALQSGELPVEQGLRV
jgi:hypothetical protein